jgi:hypothetical protein
MRLPDSRLQEAVRQEFLRYKDLREKGANYSAMAALGAVVNSVAQLPPRHEASWTARLRNERLTAVILEESGRDARRDIDRLIRILSIGPSWEFEEMVLVISRRVQVDLAIEALDFFGHSLNVDFGEVDRLLHRVAESKRNGSVYASARRQCAKNWGLPILNSWLAPREDDPRKRLARKRPRVRSAPGDERRGTLKTNSRPPRM